MSAKQSVQSVELAALTDHLQADELKAYSEKRMKELDKEIKDVEAAMVHFTPTCAETCFDTLYLLFGCKDHYTTTMPLLTKCSYSYSTRSTVGAISNLRLHSKLTFLSCYKFQLMPEMATAWSLVWR